MSVKSSSMSAKDVCEDDIFAYNKYVSESMQPENKVNCWFVNYSGMKVPIVAVAKDSTFIKTKRDEARKAGYLQFNCKQCANNCNKLVTIIGNSTYMLCSYSINTTQYSESLRNIANDVYCHIKCNPDSYSLKIATDKLILKDKYDYVNPNNPPSDDTKTYLHYAGNCDVIETNLFNISDNPCLKEHNKKAKDLNLLNLALEQYWPLMRGLLYKLTDDWNFAGRRHATLQRIRTIQELSCEITYAEAHFDKTLSWILDVLGKILHPLRTINNMEHLVQHIVNAIASGRIAYSDPKNTSVVHFQFIQMNNTIMMWMEKAISRKDLKNMMTTLCGSTKGQRTKEISIQQINDTERLIGTNFWTRVATTRTLWDFYGDDEDSKFFWVSPDIRQSNMSGGSSGFATIKANAKNIKKLKSRICKWNSFSPYAESIPELINLLVSGESIYIDCTSSEHAVLAHTSIDPQYMACCPVEGKGALMWSFLGGKGFGVHKSGNTIWRKLVAIHRMETGPYSNYILVCESSRELAQYIRKNPVMGDWTLNASCKRSMGPVFSKLKETTHLSRNTTIGYMGMGEYPIIGVGVCKGISNKLAYSQVVSYKIGTNFTKEIHTIKYYETPYPKYSPSSKIPNFCSNCGAPRPNKSANFCSNCGRSF